MSRAIGWLARGLVLLPAVVALAAAGAIYEAADSRGDGAAYPPPGRLVDIGGGPRLHIDCIGAGAPTVVMDAGLGESSLDWVLVKPRIARTTRVCVYDRAGMGWSDASPTPRTPVNIAGELDALLIRSGEAAPYVLVAHSLSGKYARAFAIAHPREVAGLVLLDARYEYMDEITPPSGQRAFVDMVVGQGRLYGLARRLGGARLFGRWLGGTPALPARTREAMAILATRPAAIAATNAEARARAASDPALRAHASLGDRPLVVLVSGQSIATTPHWAEAQRRQAALSSRGTMIVAKDSSHFIQLDAPGLVVEAVRSVVDQARIK